MKQKILENKKNQEEQMAQKRENVLRKIQQNENKMQEANQQKELER